ncbi:MAG: glycine cleavage system aminomethyltransferase GcvT [Gammaproteobacteria bacterium]
MTSSVKTTSLIDCHRSAGAKTVDFGGWDMPLHYGSQMDEHHTVRSDAGMFDVSHMTVVDLTGERVRDFLQRLLANDVAKLKVSGKALYSCMLNDSGGVIDDLIVYYLDDRFYRVVVNAATRDKDMAWIERHAANFDVDVRERTDLSMIAVQGPNARAKAASVLPPSDRDAALALKPFVAAQLSQEFVARTGYTGEDGFEIMVSNERAASLWNDLVAAGVAPCGLGARDTLRLEAGMHLYGQDMDENVLPLNCGLSWTVALEPADRDFIGRAALEKAQADGLKFRLAALVLEGRGVLRAHQSVMVEGALAGEVTSGTFSPTLKRSIGLARVPIELGDRCAVEIRGKLIEASVHNPPFVRHGQIKVDLD